jgi:hypothetical protein
MAPIAQTSTHPLDLPSAVGIPLATKLGSAKELSSAANLSSTATSNSYGTGTSNVSQIRKGDAGVTYIVNFRDNQTTTVFSSNEPFNLEPRLKPIAGIDFKEDWSPILQVHTSVFGTFPSTEGPISIKDVSIHRVDGSRMLIFSQALLKALRNVVTYYPR